LLYLLLYINSGTAVKDSSVFICIDGRSDYCGDNNIGKQILSGVVVSCSVGTNLYVMLMFR